MAEGILRSMDHTLEVTSAGTWPAASVHPRAVQVMKEIGIDISSAVTKSVEQFLGDSFDYVVTVCDHAKESCPVFTGEVKHNLHMGFEDPAMATGTENEVLNEFRRIRDQIRAEFGKWYHDDLLPGKN